MNEVSVRIKICGIKREDEVAVLNGFPVSYAGFIFAKSKRQVDIVRCRELARELRDDIKTVGVFVNEPLERLLEIVEACKLDVVQLHGEETVDYIRKIPVTVWKTLPVKNEDSLKAVDPYAGECAGILFETYHEKLKGGTGKTFDWHLLDRLKGERPFEMILAGGINPANAKTAVEIVHPDILDVNSGLEVDGYKTREKVEELFKELKI